MSERTFLLPDVGEGLVEAEIVTWKVSVGDVVTLGIEGLGEQRQEIIAA